MSAEAPFAVRRWTVGKYTCTLTAPKTAAGQFRSATIEWAPATPDRLSAAQIEEYRRGRNAAVASIAAELGIDAAVVEI